MKKGTRFHGFWRLHSQLPDLRPIKTQASNALILWWQESVQRERELVFNGPELQSGKMKEFWSGMVVMVAQQRKFP